MRTASTLTVLVAAMLPLSATAAELPPMPKGAAATAAALSHGSSDHSRRKDELWSVFRGLEADYQKYV